jgi:hypothetical protein
MLGARMVLIAAMVLCTASPLECGHIIPSSSAIYTDRAKPEARLLSVLRGVGERLSLPLRRETTDQEVAEDNLGAQVRTSPLWLALHTLCALN